MVTLSKPGSQDPNWYHAVSDNWRSIEEDLLDKSLWAAKGDLVFGTGKASPDRLPAGANDSYLMADSSQGAGMRWVNRRTFIEQDRLDLMWGKKFFEDEGLLPTTKVCEILGTPPAFLMTYTTNQWSYVQGAYRVGAQQGGLVLDLGKRRSKILFVIGSVHAVVNEYTHLYFTESYPTSMFWDGFFAPIEGAGAIYKAVNGVNTRLDTSTGIADTAQAGWAFYYDGATDGLKLFCRTTGQWFLHSSATSSAFKNPRFVQFYTTQGRWEMPMVCYVD